MLRKLPSVEAVLQSELIAALTDRYSRPLVVSAVREAVAGERNRIMEGGRTEVSSTAEIAGLVTEILEAKMRRSMRRVVNATGVVLHTNLGRALLAASAVEALAEAATHYTNLEYDLARGKRSTREIHVERLVRDLTGAEACHVVNNNAGAVLLALNSLAEGREVVVSRGELVEIGGSFRLPEVMAKSGSKLVEVGTTNRTTARDYEQAIGKDTAVLLKVHKSNFKMTGFVSEVSLEELVEMGRRKKVLVMEDLGSGAMIDFSLLGLPGEPVVADRVALGVSAVTFSCDKLLGGPQAGLIVGEKGPVKRMKENPLSRALRVDKLSMAALEATLLEILSGPRVRQTMPSVRMIAETAEEVRKRSESLVGRLGPVSDALSVTIVEGISQVGGGALPGADLKTWLISVTSASLDENAIESALREGPVPVVARIGKGAVYLDLRTVLTEEEPVVVDALRRVADVARRKR
ncbi:MAG: L-seryl-tRNA(Sec) selenium transferase [Candidatus Eisenbacteria bacterium]|nr:L-seryl-tRNA(Sec) selenium transferase [Candidatus Eisenbacteria bacterium]